MRIEDKIKPYLAANPKATYEEIAQAVESSYDTVKGTLFRMKKKGSILKTEDGWIVGEFEATPISYKQQAIEEAMEILLDNMRVATGKDLIEFFKCFNTLVNRI